MEDLSIKIFPHFDVRHGNCHRVLTPSPLPLSAATSGRNHLNK